MSLLPEIVEIINQKCIEIEIAEHMETINERRKTNWIFHFEINNAANIYEELLRLQYDVNPSIVPEGYNKVQCAVHNQLYDLHVAPMHISYVDLEPNPPQWLIDLAARNHAKHNAANF